MCVCVCVFVCVQYSNTAIAADNYDKYIRHAKCARLILIHGGCETEEEWNRLCGFGTCMGDGCRCGCGGGYGLVGYIMKDDKLYMCVDALLRKRTFLLNTTTDQSGDITPLIAGARAASVINIRTILKYDSVHVNGVARGWRQILDYSRSALITLSQYCRFEFNEFSGERVVACLRQLLNRNDVFIDLVKISRMEEYGTNHALYDALLTHGRLHFDYKW